ncbi:MAG TPA: Flp family type IVb pilin [Acidimicrobiia bacterium]
MLTLLLSRMRLDERGASMVEYALLVLLIAIVGLVAVDFFGESVSGAYSEIGSGLVGARGG